MKRAGFTMIELIFVIVILGILAAVALPKFLGVAEEANVGKLKAYVGTLNRTVMPALWSASLSAGTNGAVNGLTAIQLAEQIPTPDIGDSAATSLATTMTLPLACSAWAAAAAGDYTDPEMVGWADFAVVTISSSVYTINCMDGSGSASPRFALADSNGKVLVK